MLIYATGHEGRGIGLLNKLRAYVAQDEGADTVDANHLLGLPADARDYTGAAAVLEALGVRLHPPADEQPEQGRAGCAPRERSSTPSSRCPPSAHHRNADYLSTKTERMGHVAPGRGRATCAAPARRRSAAPGPTAGHRQVRPDAGRSHRHLDGRLPGGSAARTNGRVSARPPGRLRRRHGRRRHGPRRRPAAHRPHGPRRLSSARRPRQRVAHAAGRSGARRGRGDDDRHDGRVRTRRRRAELQRRASGSRWCRRRTAESTSALPSPACARSGSRPLLVEGGAAVITSCCERGGRPFDRVRRSRSHRQRDRGRRRTRHHPRSPTAST